MLYSFLIVSWMLIIAVLLGISLADYLSALYEQWKKREMTELETTVLVTISIITGFWLGFGAVVGLGSLGVGTIVALTVTTLAAASVRYISAGFKSAYTAAKESAVNMYEDLMALFAKKDGEAVQA